MVLTHVGLGMSLGRQWPFSGLQAIGLFVGIEMPLCGWSWVMLGLTVRSTLKQAVQL
jgi:uncharacterized membrane protein HdeD (DUF308 family)